LACDAVMKAFVAFCSSAEQHNIGVGRFVIMPDHAHLFVRGHPEFHLGRWVGQLKQHIGRALPAESATGVLWQRGFFDHVLRNSESYSEKWRYVSNNPVRHGHVTRPEDWPCAGEIMRIDRA
jgi:REP element-mobilizing transposase RayT